VSPRFMTFKYLKCQLYLDTFHHLNAPRVLSDVGYYYLYHVYYFVTLKLRSSGELIFSKPFSLEVVNVEVDSVLMI
jgi:hypothetical protein